jgi:hypothetical protein
MKWNPRWLVHVVRLFKARRRPLPAVVPRLEAPLEERVLPASLPILGVFSGHYHDQSVNQGNYQDDDGYITVSVNAAPGGNSVSTGLTGTVGITGFAGQSATLPIEIGFEEQNSPTEQEISVQAVGASGTPYSTTFFNLVGSFQGGDIQVRSYNVNNLGGYSTAYPDNGPIILADGDSAAPSPPTPETPQPAPQLQPEIPRLAPVPTTPPLQGSVGVTKVFDGVTNELPPDLRKNPAWRDWHHRLYVGPLQHFSHLLEGMVHSDNNGHRTDVRFRVSREGKVTVIDNHSTPLDPRPNSGGFDPTLTSASLEKVAEELFANLSGTVGKPGGLPHWPAGSNREEVELNATFFHRWPGGGTKEGPPPTENALTDNAPTPHHAHHAHHAHARHR